MPTDAQSFLLPLLGPGYHISGKEVEVRDSGSWHHQLCRRHNLQLIKSRVAPSHGPLARVLSPLSSRQSFSCCLSHVAKRSTPKPHGPLLFTPPKLHDPLPSSPKPRGPLSSPSEPRGSLPSPSEPCGPLYSLQNRVVLSFYGCRA